MAVFRKVEFTWVDNLINSNIALDNVRDALLARYRNSDIRRDGIAVAVKFTDGRHLDVVPALFQGMYLEKWPMYLIPDSNRAGVEANPVELPAQCQLSNTRDGDREGGGAVRKVVGCQSGTAKLMPPMIRNKLCRCV